MKLCLFILAISLIMIIASILILKNAIILRNEVKEQISSIDDEFDVFK